MKIFLAGAGGAVGRKLTPLLRAVGHTVIGSTRSADKAESVRALGAEPVVVDVFDAEALARAVGTAAPDAIIHQLTDLAFAPGTPQYDEGVARNARLRIEGTRNLVAAARGANVKRMVAQSVAFAYAPANGTRVENDPLNIGAEGTAGRSAEAGAALEQAVLGLAEGIVLRFGYFYGPGTWYDTPSRAPSIHIEAAARATMQALIKGKPGVYNIAEDGPAVSSDKAKQDFGFDPQGRIRMRS